MVLFVAKVVFVFVDTVVLVAFTIVVVVAVAFAANEVVELLFCIVPGDEDSSVIFDDGIVVELLLVSLLTDCVGGAEVVVSFPLITVVPLDVEFDKSLVSRFRILR